MNFNFDVEELRPVIAEVITEVLRSNGALLADRERLAYSEKEAGALLGVKGHVLRDARLRGEVSHVIVGSRIHYLRKDLLDYLETRRGEKRARR